MSNQYNQEYFDKKNLDSFNSRFRKFYIKLIKKILVDFLKDKKFVLDVGCGVGNHMSILKSHNIKIIGVDFSKEAIKECLIKNLKVQMASVENLPFKNSQFDGIISWCVLEHVKNYEEVIKECNRVLKKNGKLVLATEKPSKEFKSKDRTHVKPFTKEEITYLLSKHNFKIIETKSDLFYKGMSRIPFKIAHAIGSLLGKFTSSIIIVYAVKI